MISIDDYSEVRDCIYKDELYSARDNGAVMRHPRKGKRIRKDDDVWTFGKPNDNTGYMEFAGQRVHRIVAFAFLGIPPTDQHVVDHIDTNRRNNRPENLRWLTKLENILRNEITRKKVEMICGSIEAFLENPQLLYGHESEDKNFLWMRAVTPEEARNCLEHWMHWAQTAKPGSPISKGNHQVDSWIFDAPNNRETTNSSATPVYSFTQQSPIAEENDTEFELTDEDFHESYTLSARHFWRTKTEFPCCPTVVSANGLEVYKENLKSGLLFSSNELNKYYVIDREIVSDKLYVLCKTKDDNYDMFFYNISMVWIRNDFYAHFRCRTYDNIKEATRWFNIFLGKEKMTESEELNWDC